MPRKRYLISTSTAMKLAYEKFGIRITQPTIRARGKAVGFAWRLGGKGSPFVVDKKKFIEFIRGNLKEGATISGKLSNLIGEPDGDS